MPRNESPRQISPRLEAAVRQSVNTMLASGFTDEDLAGEQLPLLSSSVAVRANLISEDSVQRRQDDRDLGNAIGAYLMGKLPLQ